LIVAFEKRRVAILALAELLSVNTDKEEEQEVALIKTPPNVDQGASWLKSEYQRDQEFSGSIGY